MNTNSKDLERKYITFSIAVVVVALFLVEMNFVLSSYCFSTGDPSGYALSSIATVEKGELVHDFVIYYFKKYPSSITHPLDHWFSLLIFFTSFLYLVTGNIKFSLLFITIFFECLTVLIVSLFLFKLLKNKVLTFFSLLLVINPIFVFFSLQGYPVVLLCVFLNLFFLTLLLYENTKNEKYLLFSSLFLGFSFLSHILGILAYPILVLYLIFFKSTIQKRKIILYLLLPIFLYFPLILRNLIFYGTPFYSLHIFEVFRVGVGDNFYKEHFSIYFDEKLLFNKLFEDYPFLFWKVKKTFFDFLFGRLYWLQQEGFIKNLTPLVLFPFIGGVIFSIVNRKRILILQNLYVFLHVLVLAIFWHYIDFYLLPILPLVVYNVSYFFDFLISHEKKIKKRKKVIQIFVVILILSSYFYLQFDYFKMSIKTAYNENVCKARYDVAIWLKNHTEKNSAFMAPLPWDLQLISGIKSLPLPYSTYLSLLEVSKYYNVSYIIIPKYFTYYSPVDISKKYKELEPVYENSYFFVFKVNYNQLSDENTYNTIFIEDVFEKALEQWNIFGMKKENFYNVNFGDKIVYFMEKMGKIKVKAKNYEKCFIDFGAFSLFRNRTVKFYLNNEEIFEINLNQIPTEFRLLFQFKKGENEIKIEANSCDIPSKIGAWEDDIHCLSVAFYKIEKVCINEN